jgi:hypothetical protein
MDEEKWERGRVYASLLWLLHAHSGLRLISLPYFYYYHSKNHYTLMITKTKEKFLVV